MQEKSYREILKDIRDIKIQGANNVAINGIKAALLQPDEYSLKQILLTRPTEPLLQTSLKIISKSKYSREVARNLIHYIEQSKKEIARFGARLIKNDMNIFSHCHSSTVMEILKYAHKVEKKNFVVYTLEVEPILQGRITAKELASEGIQVVVLPDLAAEQAIKNCDLFLFGADAFTSAGVANKIGTKILCEIAKNHKIKRYSCGLSLKYTTHLKIEQRPGREVWDERNSKIKVVNPAFDFTPKKYLTGVISENGILNYSDFIKKSKEKIKRLEN